jgi:hypothetical protein
MALPQAEGNQHKRLAKKEEEKETTRKKEKKREREKVFPSSIGLFFHLNWNIFE